MYFTIKLSGSALLLWAVISLLAPPRTFAQATIDETPFARNGNGIVLYVNKSAAANDKNTGQNPNKPLATIGHAVALATEMTNTVPVKIKVGAGTYREHLQIAGGNKLLEIEGTSPGKVFISGSQAKGWELSKWTPIAGVPGLYKKAWPSSLGLVEPMGNDQIGKYRHLAVFRRDAVYVNGAGLSPVQLEDYAYDYHAALRYLYKGYHDPAKEPTVIPPGSFAVNDQKSDHSDANTLFLRLPAGVDPKTAQIEVPDDSLVSGLGNSKKLLVEVRRGNFVMRNLSVIHAACYYNFAAVGVNLNVYGSEVKDFLRNLLFENCEFNWNNGIGLDLTSCHYFTIRNCRALHNGNGGIDPWVDHHMLMEDNDTSYNCWAARLSGDGWLAAGSKAMIQDSIIRRETSTHNGYIGFWLDFGYRGDNANNTFEDCNFSDNVNHGLLFEIATGPNYVRNCRVVGNGANGIESSYQARQTYIDHCVIINNAATQLNVVAQASGTAVAEGRNGNPDNVLCTKVTNCIIASTQGQQLTNFYNDGGFLTNGDTVPGGPRFQASGNTYWDTDPKKFKVIWWSNNIDFTEWQKKTGQDGDSQFARPNVEKLLAWNPALPTAKRSATR